MELQSEEDTKPKSMNPISSVTDLTKSKQIHSVLTKLPVPTITDEKCDSNSNIMNPESNSTAATTIASVDVKALETFATITESGKSSEKHEIIRSKYKNISTCTVVLNSIDPIIKVPHAKKAVKAIGPKSVIAALAKTVSAYGESVSRHTNINTTSTTATTTNTSTTRTTLFGNETEITSTSKAVNSSLATSDDDIGEIFEFEECDVPHVPLYHLRDEGAVKWALLNDLCYLLKVKSKDTLLKQVNYCDTF